MKNKNLIIIICILWCCITPAQACKKLRVLFVGNSYTYVNNMPQIVADMATSMGDTLIWEMEAPGGTYLMDHAQSQTTINKIKAGHWNYVVLQEQSQNPAIPEVGIQTWVLPYAEMLDSFVNKYNECAETVFYMTWGRKNGDAYNCEEYKPYNWPYFCTYNTMDSLIRLRYMMMADSNEAIVSPAGAVWRYIRSQYPNIKLYDADESHPSPAGSYTAAVSFYTTFFKKDPLLINYDFTLPKANAADIRTAVKKVVYDSMAYWHIGEYKTEARFEYSTGAGTISFTNTSLNATSYIWDFGDGQTATNANATHSYAQTGKYNIRLIATGNTGCSDTSYAIIPVFATGIDATSSTKSVHTLSPNPCKGYCTLDVHGQPAEVSVMNAYGQTIYRTTGNGKIILNLNDQPKGLYIVRMKCAGEIKDIKLTVQ